MEPNKNAPSRLSAASRIFAIVGLCATAAITLPAQLLTLRSLDGTFGINPEFAELIQGSNGNLYGTTSAGGAYGAGAIFEVTPDGGTLIGFYSFDPSHGDGGRPYAGLVQGNDGDFYGTTNEGGSLGFGTVFKITQAGVLTTLHNFCSQPNCADGSYPYNSLVQSPDGNLYGTTSGFDSGGFGTVFKLTPGGTLTTIYSFCAEGPPCSDGGNPYAGLVQGANGNFYGTTSAYGDMNSGTAFEMTPNGSLTTLHAFCSAEACTDGAFPYAGLFQSADGDFYGTTSQGGKYGQGTVFRMSPNGTVIPLHSFCLSAVGCSSGVFERVTEATDGNFYGTTLIGGANNGGTVFRMTPGGVFTTLYSFCAKRGCVDGQSPYAALIQGTSGELFGTTLSGGTSNDGAVFSLSVGLSPFVETRPRVGKVGEEVKILGTYLRDASSVNFNGTTAASRVISKSEIVATVPTGATTGEVNVVTPNGTVSSNLPFRVLP